MKALLFANTDWYLYNFRLSLAERLRTKGWEVILVSPPGEYGKKLEALGFRYLSLPFSGSSTNPVQQLSLICKLFQLYRHERPDLAHHFTIKCVLYGSIAAKLAGGIMIVNAVTGLGHIFTDPGLKARLIRPIVHALYRLALRGDIVRVIYQNTDDRDSFLAWGLVQKARTHLIRGSGVDVSRFKRETKDDERSASTEVKLLFASRLLREKGIFELIKAFSSIRKTYPATKLLIAGEIYPENPSSLSQRDINELKTITGITFLGHIEDMRAILCKCDIVVLPSYREGTPRILIEAAAMEKPIITTDIAGCRGLVVDGVNGMLVPMNDSERLAEAIEELLISPTLRLKMGKAGRQIVLEEFDEEIVIEKTLKVYGELTGIR